MAKQTEETKIKHQVRDYLRLNGWFVYHNLASLGAYKGISDFVCIKDGIVVFAEIKKEKGIQSDNQIEFQRQVEAHGGHYRILKSVEDAIELNKWLDMAVY